jgi:hypothetical protein
MNKSKISAFIVFLGVLIVGFAGYYAYKNQKFFSEQKNSNIRTKSENQESNTINDNTTKQPEEEILNPYKSSFLEIEQDKTKNTSKSYITTDILKTIVGNSKGSATVLNSSLDFPVAIMDTQPTNDFTLTTKDFDLKILNDKDLTIENETYPKLMFVIGGFITEQSNEKFVTINTFTPEFYIQDNQGTPTALATEIQTSLINKLKEKGIILPPISQANPIKLPVDIIPKIEGGFTINSAKDSGIVFNFETDSI